VVSDTAAPSDCPRSGQEGRSRSELQLATSHNSVVKSVGDGIMLVIYTQRTASALSPVA
jgi:hypothetical protein